ncbi:hypothetical protein [Bacteroides sp.]
MVKICKAGGFGSSSVTNQTALARFIYRSGLVLCRSRGEWQPMKLSSLITLINTVWNEEYSRGSRQWTGQQTYGHELS